MATILTTTGPTPPDLTAKFRRATTMAVPGGTVTITALPGRPTEAAPRPNRKPGAGLGAGVSKAQMEALQGAFDHFNAELWGGRLMPVILNFSRHANTFGFFAPERWYDADGEMVTHEISLNPIHLRSRDLRATYSTLVHEMAHLWQQEHGKKKSKRGYHNGEWADEMDRIGLTPTSTGFPGGARVGHKVTHMVLDGGAYDRAFQTLPEACKLPWLCEEPMKAERKKPQRSKIKYTCPDCEFRAWAKPAAKVMCGECEELMVAEELDDEDETEAGGES